MKRYTLLEDHEIFAASHKRSESIIGVYFLFQGLRIVYVGRSADCLRRIIEHKRDRSKAFDRYAIQRCRQKDLGPLEALYIAKFRPKYNSQWAVDRMSDKDDPDELVESRIDRVLNSF